MYPCLEYLVWVTCILNPLPDNKILDWSKLKEIADDIQSAFKMENKYYIG